ncbi:MAG: hypothetical protein RIT02_2530 [Planctomycetota bacterium]|jgi:sarcosine oxidase gamma subunit
MDHDDVRKLEDLLEECLERMFRRKDAESLPWQPDGRVVHLMAKAAGAAYEAACHAARPRRRRGTADDQD